MADIQINNEVQNLLNTVNESFPGEVRLHFGTDQAGYVRHDQAQQISDGQKMLVEVSDITEPNYTASHELLHMLMVLKGFPQIYFQLTTDDAETDQQLMFLITELYDVVAHEVVVAEQRKHNLITEEVKDLFLRGIETSIEPEKDGAVDGMSTLRLLMLLNAQVFYGEEITHYAGEFDILYPTAWQAAQSIYAEISKRTITSPFDMRRKVIKLFNIFDAQLEEWGIAELHSLEFATLGSVVSERQLRLTVNQLFQVFHSELHARNTQKRAYIGIGISDQQNSFVVPEPKNIPSDEYFKQLYAKNVKEFLEEIKMPYTIR